MQDSIVIETVSDPKLKEVPNPSGREK